MNVKAPEQTRAMKVQQKRNSVVKEMPSSETIRIEKVVPRIVKQELMQAQKACTEGKK